MRRSPALARRFVALLATLALLCASLFGFVPVTPQGIQCPTAPVQTVAVRDCCGRLVTRAPRPGDRVFVQCRCAEKKGAAQHVVVSGPRFEIAPPAPFELALPTALLATRSAFAYAAPDADWRAAPPVRPPAFS